MGQIAYDSKTLEINEETFIHNTYWTGFYDDVEDNMSCRLTKP